MWWIVCGEAVTYPLDENAPGDPEPILEALRAIGWDARVVYERPPSAPAPMSREQVAALLSPHPVGS